MKIAICDDCIEDLSKIEKLLLKYKSRCPDRVFELKNSLTRPDCTREYRRGNGRISTYWTCLCRSGPGSTSAICSEDPAARM